MTLSGMICRLRARTCYLPAYQIRSSISAHYEDMKRDTKFGKGGGLDR